MGWLLGIGSIACLVLAPRLPRPPRDVAFTASAALLTAAAYVRADSLDQFLQFTMLGIAFGSIYAIAAAGLVLTYTTTGVFNFAHGALGMIAAFLYWGLSVDMGLPVPVAALVVLGLVGPGMGLVLELMFRRFRDADVGTTIVLTIAVTVLCIGVAQKAFGTTAHNLPPVLAGGNIDVLGAPLTRDNVLQIAVAVAIAAGLRTLLHSSRTGVAMRAVVDNATLASLNGASPVRTARISWILGTELAVVAGILFASGTNLEAITLTFFVVSAYGAAVFGKLRSLPLTFAGAIVLGVIQNWGPFLFPTEPHGLSFADFTPLGVEQWRRINVALPGIFLFFAVLALPQAKLTIGRVVGRRAPAVPTLRGSLVRSGVFLAAMAAYVQLVPDARLADSTRALIFGVMLLSLVLLTGFSGQVSLAQYVFVALGAWAAGHFFGGDSLLGIVVAGLFAVPFGAIVALPALRLQGLYLALVTFGFAAVARDVLIQDPFFYGLGPATIGRPEVLGLSFAGDKAFFMLCAAVFCTVALAVLALRRGPFGRRLAAMRDSQAACATLGLDIRATKLVVFCMSAAIAGMAGALFGAQQGSVTDITFEPANNLVLFLFAVVGGVTTVSGAFLGGALFAILPFVQAEYADWAGIPFAAVAVVAILLGRQPNGLAGIVYEQLERLFGRHSPVGATTASEPASSTGRQGAVRRREEVPVHAPA
jgi:branched-chain amino acid transport system permease protein